MRWYVSNNGESSGPHEEATVAAWVREGQLGAAAMLRDEAASSWVPLAHTPFAMLSPQVPQTAPPVAAARPKPKQAGALPSLLVILFGLWMIYLYATCGDKKPPSSAVAGPTLPAAPAVPAKAAGPTAIDAWVMAESFVKNSLKSPGSADFGGVFSGDFQKPAEHCTDVGDKTWKCFGWVDAQNEFGAKLRADFKVTVKNTDADNWRAVEGPTLTER